MGITVNGLTRLRNKNRQPSLVVAAELVNNDASREIFKIDKICHAIVSIEPRKNNNSIPQCFRCQRFGHTRNYCNMSYRCVKCLGEHYYKDCPKTQDTPPTCVNCKENHPANYRGCKHYTNLTQNAATKKAQQTSHNRNNNTASPADATANPPPPTTPYFTSPQPHTSSFTPTRSYANTTANVPGTFNNNNNNPTIIDQVMNFIYNLIMPHLEQIKTFVFTHIIPAFFNGSK